jgi:hypothetical protein
MLYKVARRKSDTIAHVLSAISLNVSFRRYLAGNNLVLWNNLVTRVALVQLVDSEDVIILLVGGDVPVDGETLLVTDFVNLKIMPAQSFGDAHRGRVCVRVFIG